MNLQISTQKAIQSEFIEKQNHKDLLINYCSCHRNVVCHIALQNLVALHHRHLLQSTPVCRPPVLPLKSAELVQVILLQATGLVPGWRLSSVGSACCTEAQVVGEAATGAYCSHSESLENTRQNKSYQHISGLRQGLDYSCSIGQSRSQEQPISDGVGRERVFTKQSHKLSQTSLVQTFKN